MERKATIQVTQPCSIEGTERKAGEVVTVDRLTAARLIASGEAIPTEPETRETVVNRNYEHR